MEQRGEGECRGEQKEKELVIKRGERGSDRGEAVKGERGGKVRGKNKHYKRK